MDHKQLADLHWLGLTPEEIEQCGAGPLQHGLFDDEGIIPAKLL